MKRVLFVLLAAAMVLMACCSVSAQADGPQMYTVLEGDTCLSIANKFGIELDYFMLVNNMTECSIQAGNPVIIPARPAPTPAPRQAMLYTVAPEDTCESIAQKFDVDYDIFMVINRMETCQIQAGSTVIIPAQDQKMPRPESLPANIQFGDIIEFGHYEQDNNPDNGPEPIKWRVLWIEDGRALVFSIYGLDVKQYDTGTTSVTWAASSLRSWLNGDFYRTAFNAEERAWIAEVDVTTADNPNEGTSGGKKTHDRLFLLSYDETNDYFSSDLDLRCKATPYAEAKGGKVSVDSGFVWWWLRSPGQTADKVMFVHPNGHINLQGASMRANTVLVRPAFWLVL